ncbi:MAG TPA: hypothetical protein VGW37_10600 [Terriglobia bacterium]|nr:hypothetical protein [Terriglobia bacterium]
MTDEQTLDQYQRMTEERIIARRIMLDEFLNCVGKLEYIKGRILTGSGIELFVGVKEFPESIRALEEEKKRMLEDGAPRV